MHSEDEKEEVFVYDKYQSPLQFSEMTWDSLFKNELDVHNQHVAH